MIDKKSRTYRLGVTMAKKAQGYMGIPAMQAALVRPPVTPGSAGRGSPAAPGMTPAQPSSSSATPDVRPPAVAPVPKSTPAPQTASPARPSAAPPAPAVTASPATAGARRPPTRPMASMMMSRRATMPMLRSAAYRAGQTMAKQAADKRARATFMKIAKVLGKRAGLSEKELAGMEKEALAWLPAAILGLLTAAGTGYGVHQYGKHHGWWESPAIKAMKDRMRAIQMAQAQGIDPARLGLVAPKPEKEQDAQPYWGSWDGGGYGGAMPAGLPKGYMDQEKRLQNLSRSLGLGLRHSRAWSQLSRMPVY